MQQHIMGEMVQQGYATEKSRFPQLNTLLEAT